MKSKEIRKKLFADRVCDETDGYWGIPIVKKQELDLRELELISLSDTKANDTRNRHKAVHFFEDDPRFNGVYVNPKRSFKKLSQYRFLTTPDFSQFGDMENWEQLGSVAKNRWCGWWWQKHGLKVAPTMSWSDYQSYDYSCAGVEQGSIVAVGMSGCKRRKRNFLRGYDHMLDVVAPSAVICLGTPFPEMRGNIIAIDYINSKRGNR